MSLSTAYTRPVGTKVKGGKPSKGSKVVVPKAKCCDDSPKCGRCPLRLLKEQRMPDGLTVRKRRVVSVTDPTHPLSKKELAAHLKRRKKGRAA